MDTDVYYKLKKIKEKYGEQKLGQICQNLLALALKKKFQSANIEVNNVEGVDIIIEAKSAKYAIEIKTTSLGNINFGEKDYRGLQKYKKQDYKPTLAVLKIGMSKEWIFYDAKGLKHKTNLSVNALYTADEFKELAKDVHKSFEEILKQYYQNIMQERPEVILDILKEEGLKYTGD